MYKILSFEGGGVYGGLTIGIIENLLKKFPKLIKDADLITGTSIGATIGLMLAKGISCRQIKTIFPKASKEIFERDTYRSFLSTVGFKAFYPNENLKKYAEAYFGKMTLGELKKKVLVPAFNLDNKSEPRHWKAKFFHNFESDDSDKDVKIVDIILATTAAPVFFPTHGTYADGSLVENNPAICAVAQTQDERMKIDPRPKFDEVVVFSLGRQNPSRYVEGENLDWGYFKWIGPMINIALDRDSSVIDYQCRKLLKDRYYRVAPTVPKELDQRIDTWSLVPELLTHAAMVDLSEAEEWLQKKWN